MYSLRLECPYLPPSGLSTACIHRLSSRPSRGPRFHGRRLHNLRFRGRFHGLTRRGRGRGRGRNRRPNRDRGRCASPTWGIHKILADSMHHFLRLRLRDSQFHLPHCNRLPLGRKNMKGMKKKVTK